jgi:hypothetical protein
MIQKAIEQINKQDIESLVNAKVSESRALDYKQQLPENDADSKREFLYDVSSFANASGGDLVFGVADERDASGKSTGLPASAEGLNLPNISEAIARLENLIRDGITPRIQTVQWQPAQGFPVGPVLVMRIPKSLIGPHMVIYGGMARFYSRNSTGKYPMDYREIKAAFGESADIGDRLRAFREGRIAEIISGNTPLGAVRKGVLVLHFIPLSSLSFDVSRDVSRIAGKANAMLEPITASGWGGHYNFDGYRVVSTASKSYVQVFRTGTIEAVDAYHLDIKFEGLENQISNIAFEETILRAVRRYLDAQRHFAIPLPIFIVITLLFVKGFSMSSFVVAGGPAIDRDNLLLPEVVLEDYATDVGRLLHPSFDALWQSCGQEKSLNYDEEGN